MNLFILFEYEVPECEANCWNPPGCVLEQTVCLECGRRVCIMCRWDPGDEGESICYDCGCISDDED
jgi:hypothetical protein